MLDNVHVTGGSFDDFEYCSDGDRVIVKRARKEDIERAVIPDGVAEICPAAFAECHELREIILPESLEVIGECAFYECTSLVNIHLPASVRAIGHMAFADCARLEEVVFEETHGWTGECHGVDDVQLDMQNSKANAVNLRGKYWSYDWKRQS